MLLTIFVEHFNGLAQVYFIDALTLFGSLDDLAKLNNFIFILLQKSIFWVHIDSRFVFNVLGS